MAGNGELSRIRLNSRGMAKLLNSRAIGGALMADAQAVAARARSLAPVDTGEYRDSIRVEPARPHDRQVVRVVAGARHAQVVERNDSTLARALGASSGRSRKNR